MWDPEVSWEKKNNRQRLTQLLHMSIALSLRDFQPQKSGQHYYSDHHFKISSSIFFLLKNNRSRFITWQKWIHLYLGQNIYIRKNNN